MAATEPRRKVDRDEVFLEYTRSVCPVCKTVIDAEVNVRDNRVILRKRCREHGVFEALVYSDAELYMAQQRFNKPGTIPLEFQTEVAQGCPLDCGMCPEHKQHACQPGLSTLRRRTRAARCARRLERRRVDPRAPRLRQLRNGVGAFGRDLALLPRARAAALPRGGRLTHGRRRAGRLGRRHGRLSYAACRPSSPFQVRGT
jgi:uncharacterized radical SAM superfamily Fe-S cluster-containing enzyme